jgi:glycosyltransferase involved in cell wall biosynthesis
LGSLSGVDLNKLNPNLINSNICIELKKKFNLHQSDFVITYMARKTLDKGALDMLEIFFILNNISTSKNIKLLYIGPDESNGIVEAYLEKNNFENIIVIGEVNEHQYYLGISNLLCLPSHKEGFGSVVIDAASIGVPTIGYNIIGLKDAIIDNYTGWLINENDKELFANQIIQLIENEKLLFQISKNAYEYCKTNFDADKYHLELLNKYYSEI